jgi:hypothetical protein
MFSGKKEPSKLRSGGNAERENFRKKVSEMPRGGEMEGAKKPPMKDGGGSETTIMHNGDGSHSVMHADGEKTEHPTIGHAMMAIHGKQSDGEGHHMEVHPHGGATTHHVDMAGMVSGPHEHQDGNAAAEHIRSMVDEHEGMGPIDTNSVGATNHGEEDGLY